MKRILVAVACLLPFALAAEAGINRHSPEAAVTAVYSADEAAIQGRGDGIMGDNTGAVFLAFAVALDRG
jgi:hypothetical protein